MSAPIQVVLVEDDPILRASLASYLELAGFSTTALGDCLALYNELAARHFDVAIIDLGLPDQSGDVLVSYLRRNTHCVIIVITARDTIDTRVASYRIGADLFLGKPVDGRELAAAITSLAARRATVPAISGAMPPIPPIPPIPVAAHGTPTIASESRAATPATWIFVPQQRILINPAGQSVDLTAKEAHLLVLLTAPPMGTVARGHLLEALYQRRDESADRALDTLVRRTRRTIEAASGIPAPILTEHSVGYLFAANVVVKD